MIGESMQNGLNDQINGEFYAAFLYLSMSANLDAKSFTGMAQWLRTQYEEELGHGLKIMDFVIDRGGAVRLKEVQAPPAGLDTPLACFEAALEHERKVTRDLARLYDLAGAEKDPATHSMLEWFMEEQVEEERTAEEIVDRLRLAGNDGAALLIMDAELGRRPAGSASAADSAT